MDLRESKFYYAGDDMNFAVFSDHPCRVRYVESIPLPIGQAPVEVYAIEPGANSQWVVVQQRNDGQSRLKFFLREAEIFRENQFHELPEHVKEPILQRVSKISLSSEVSRAA
jgi:hypothetical protein